MKQVILLLTIALFLISVDSKADNKDYYRKKLQLSAFFDYESGSGFFDRNGTMSTNFYDSLPRGVNTYNPEFSNYKFGFQAGYLVANQFLIRAELPFSYYTSHETYQDKSGLDTQYYYPKSKDRGDFSFFQPQYYGLGLDYDFLKDGWIIPSINLFAKAPTKFKNGIQNKLSDSLLRWGCYELFTSAGVTFNFEKSWVALNIGYNLRDNVLKDQIILKLEGALATVPTTTLSAFARAVWSASPLKFQPEINTRQLEFQSNYVDVGVKFKIFIDNDVFTQVAYDLKVAGINTWNLGTLNFTVGTIIK